MRASSGELLVSAAGLNDTIVFMGGVPVLSPVGCDQGPILSAWRPLHWLIRQTLLSLSLHAPQGLFPEERRRVCAPGWILNPRPTVGLVGPGGSLCTGCVTLDKSLNLSGSQFLHL